MSTRIPDRFMKFVEEVNLGLTAEEKTTQSIKDDGFVFRETNIAFLAWCAGQENNEGFDDVLKFSIDIEKLLCDKLGREWSPSRISIQTLLEKLIPFTVAEQLAEDLNDVKELVFSALKEYNYPDLMRALGIVVSLIENNSIIPRKIRNQTLKTSRQKSNVETVIRNLVGYAEMFVSSAHIYDNYPQQFSSKLRNSLIEFKKLWGIPEDDLKLDESPLSKEEIEFVKAVCISPGSKYPNGENSLYADDGTPLWEKPEKLGLIEAVGSYKWKPLKAKIHVELLYE